MTDIGKSIARADVVNLARNMLEVRDCKGITTHGVRMLCEAILAMDTALSQQSSTFTIDQVHQALLDHAIISDTEREDILAGLGNNSLYTASPGPQTEQAKQVLRDAQEATFEAWWSKMGQYGRAGGGGYEKTFAWNAWCAAVQSVAENPTVKESLTHEGCTYCTNPLFIGTKCKNCGREPQVETPEMPNDDDISEALIQCSDVDGIAYDAPSFEAGYKRGSVNALDSQEHPPAQSSYDSQDLTIAYMSGYSKGKSDAKAKQDISAQHLYEGIKDCLLAHRMHNFVDEDGGGFPLVDHLSQGPSIGDGQHEITLICDSIYNTVLLPAAQPE